MEKRSIENEIRTSYLEYAMSVIVSRAIPEVRDGLKPVQRRILYAMNELGVTHDKPYKKSARIVGETMGKYHPHGDVAIYDTLARMAQEFSMRYPLIDGQGNFGSVDGDSPAAMRYTEARLASLSEEMMKDIEKNTVPFRLNFDGSLEEPEYFPTKVPHLLINGGSGIAVGMATNMVPHNMKEVCSAIEFAVDNPEITVDDLLKYIKGPDFPGGGIVFYTDDLVEAYRTGKGKAIMHGEVDLSESNHIVVKSLPYGVNKANFIQNVAEQVKDEVIKGVTDIRDETDRRGMRIVIKVRDNEMRPMIVNQLYEHTELETSIGIINLVLVNNQPKTMNLKDLIFSFIGHRLDIITKSAKFDLEKYQQRAHILEGIITALNNLDEVIETIRGSVDPKAAKSALMDRFSLTDEQATAILDLRLQKLTSLEVGKVKEEMEDVRKQIAKLQKILSDENERRKIIKEEMQYLSEKYGDKRRTKITYRQLKTRSIEDLIPMEESVIILSEEGLLKRVSLDEYRAQRRGGKGIITTTRTEDSVRNIVVCNSHDEIYLFTNTGRVLKTKAYEIEKKNRRSVGVSASVFVPLAEGERVKQIMKEPDGKNVYLVILTRNGFIKRTPFKDLLNMRSSGLKVIRLEDDDEVVAVEASPDDRKVAAVSSSGKAAIFDINEVRTTGRNSRGVRAMKLKNGDYVITGFTVSDSDEILTVSEFGKGKRTQVSAFPVHHRGTMGTLMFKRSESTGKLVKAISVSPDDEILIVTSNEKTIRLKVSEIRLQSRVT
ncbi:MAG: DNA gyrase subunit A, partial [Thermoplasmataceae archaeon]